MFKWTPPWFFFFIFSLHVVSILIFTRGFLLTRTELPFYSNCTDASLSPCFPHSPNPNPNPNLDTNSTNEEPQRCWTKPVIDRLVIIVLDALRIDFVAPSSFFKEKKPWMDKLQVLQKMASKEGASAKIFKAIADPPTTSLQRLKGLTTGGLPTFVDVGNSFGAPAIVEDNLLNQLIQSGKRVVMMGDDTWVQLFPHHFNRSYPFPSFNVKDLHTVDNGCIENLLPSLNEKDWDVLIAHFLGVDHAGHIFGVDSTPMIEKLEQYNNVLEKVIGILESQSAPGGLHENTLLLVMGDHGQTLNGDHGGGSAEEVETSMFAMSFRRPPLSMPPELDISCDLDVENKVCISSIQQLDFAVTVSALLGVPFPFGSIGRVNPELYALAASTWNMEDLEADHCKYGLKSQQWLRNYADVLCMNSWQVKRYIDIYSASSLIGFSSEDLLHIGDAYAEAEKRYRQFKDGPSCESEDVPLSRALKNQIDAYTNFLARVAELARSKWTEFNLEMMGVGFGLMLLSLVVHILGIKRMSEQCGHSSIAFGCSGISSGLAFACFMVVIHAGSLLSNSYILEEGKVANFLLATAGITKLRSSITKRKRILEAGVFVLLISIIRFTIEAGLSKQAATSAFLHFDHSWMLGINIGHPAWIYLFELLPYIALIFLAYLLYNMAVSSFCNGTSKVVLVGSVVSCMLVAVQWASESDLFSLSLLITGKNLIPRIIYAIGLGQLAFLLYNKLSFGNDVIDCRQTLFIRTVAMLSVWSSTVIILSGKQGAFAAIASIIGGYCIMTLQNTEVDNKTSGIFSINPLSVTEWSLLSVCMFFCTGHWCAFDGLRYGAAFIGFDEFVLIRQAILLTIDTFGFSHFIPICGLPFLVLKLYTKTKQPSRFLNLQLSLVYMMYGLITAVTATVTMLCVAIQRRHLMVWGLFVPKFVFDVVGLLLSDVLIFLMSHYYSLPSEDDKEQDNSKEK